MLPCTRNLTSRGRSSRGGVTGVIGSGRKSTRGTTKCATMTRVSLAGSAQLLSSAFRARTFPPSNTSVQGNPDFHWAETQTAAQTEDETVPRGAGQEVEDLTDDFQNLTTESHGYGEEPAIPATRKFHIRGG